jgi:hypothetical protein
VPELTVHASRQRYENVSDGIVRFRSLDVDFTTDLELDADGLVLRYPTMAERL